MLKGMYLCCERNMPYFLLTQISSSLHRPRPLSILDGNLTFIEKNSTKYHLVFYCEVMSHLDADALAVNMRLWTLDRNKYELCCEGQESLDYPDRWRRVAFNKLSHADSAPTLIALVRTVLGSCITSISHKQKLSYCIYEPLMLRET